MASRARKPVVLLLTHSGDYYTIDLVAEAVRALGAAPVRINTDLYPTQLQLTAHFTRRNSAFWLDTGQGTLRLDRVRAIWSRRLWPGALSGHVDARFVEQCRANSRTAFLDSLALVRGARWVNPLREALAAESKLLQLQVAGEVGLRLPETLVTNSPSRVRSLHQRHGRLVTKLLLPLSQTMDGSGAFLYTSEVKREDLEALEGLAYSPQIFQPLVEKRQELRAIVVGKRFFVGGFDASKSDRGRVDWRRSSPSENIPWTRQTLPAAVRRQVLALMKRLGLTYGALDFIVDGRGHPIFLEINPAGEWGWLQRDLGYPIAETIAEELVRGEPQ